MKINKWTMGLAAIGAVSLASAVSAEEAKSSVATALSSTILSGYVDTSAQWNLGTGNTHAPAYKYGGAAKADGFNLNAIKLSLEKPIDESEWAAGYKVDLLFGPDANVLGTTSSGAKTSDFAIKQGYVALRAPIGTGLDIKVGVFDSIIGYESTESANNPNYTRSWGHTFEPSTHTGVLTTYHIDSHIAVSAGVANTFSPGINFRAVTPGTATQSESYKTYMASVALTAPDDWGFLSGSTLYGGIVNGWNSTGGQPQTSLYVGATVSTPVTGLKAGYAFDYAKAYAETGSAGRSAHSIAGYASYQATEKLSLHGRAEYADLDLTTANLAQTAGVGFAGGGIPSTVLAITGTAQYDLWKNVISRVEIRWDHSLDGSRPFGGNGVLANSNGHITTGDAKNAWLLAANLIYKF